MGCYYCAICPNHAVTFDPLLLLEEIQFQVGDGWEAFDLISKIDPMDKLLSIEFDTS